MAMGAMRMPMSMNAKSSGLGDLGKLVGLYDITDGIVGVEYTSNLGWSLPPINREKA